MRRKRNVRVSEDLLAVWAANLARIAAGIEGDSSSFLYFDGVKVTDLLRSLKLSIDLEKAKAK